MAEFPPNLDHGDLFLPPDVFLGQMTPCKHNHRSLLASSSCMDELDLARHLAALSLLRNHSSRVRPISTLTTPSLSQRVKPAVRDVSADYVARGCFGVNGRGGGVGGGGGGSCAHRLRAYGTGRVLGRTEPVYEFKVQPQVDDGYLGATRARLLLQRQQHRSTNRVYPFQGSGAGVGHGGGGGLGRESGGTGVFHPRIVNHTATTDDKKKQGVRHRQEVQVTQQRDPMRRFGVNKKQEDCYYHLPPEMGLPREWTY